MCSYMYNIIYFTYSMVKVNFVLKITVTNYKTSDYKGLLLYTYIFNVIYDFA